MQSIFDHEPAWRCEWRDRDGMLLEARLVSREGYDDLLSLHNAVKEGGESAVEVRFVPLNENIAEERG